MTGQAAPQANAPTFGRGLYYPYFRVQDVNWLKAALLYWDEISCIVPQDYDPGNPEPLKPAEEFILALDPSPYTQRAEATFRQHVLPVAEQRDRPEAQAMLDDVARALGDRHVWVHANKMTGKLRQELEHRGLLREDVDGRMFLSDGFDALYMICLAKEMGLATRRPPLTDAKEYAECQALLQFGGEVAPSSVRGNQGEADSSMLVQLGIAMPSPEQLASVSLEAIVQHHRTREGERRAFRQSVQETAAMASGIADPTALGDYLNDQTRDIKNQIGNYRKTLDELKVGAVESALKISSPAWLTTAGSLAGGLGDQVSGILAGLGIAVSAIAWWATVRRERRQAMASCPWHYWLDTRRRFERT